MDTPRRSDPRGSATGFVNPLTEANLTDAEDAKLAIEAASGNRTALEALIRRHQGWMYNIALRMVMTPADAEDLTQEALVRVITRIAQFKGQSQFRTWAYRIVVNTILNAKRKKMETLVTGFDAYGDELDRLPLAPLTLPPEQEPDRALIVEEAKIGCMQGMLLCLDRDQRMAYVLGEIFEVPSDLAAEILGMTAAGFRKRLERARKDLTSFMTEKCGLVNAANPCRCQRKTKAFIEAGFVDPDNRQFTSTHVSRSKERAEPLSASLDALTGEAHAELFRAHHFTESHDFAANLKRLIEASGLDWDGAEPRH